MVTADQLIQLVGNKNSALFLLIGATILLILILSPKRGKSPERHYYAAKRMRRKQIEQHISVLEKKILELDKVITRIKVREHDLEIKFSVQRDENLQRELQRLRRRLAELANKRDRLLEQKQAYSKAYREVTL